MKSNAHDAVKIRKLLFLKNTPCRESKTTRMILIRKMINTITETKNKSFSKKRIMPITIAGGSIIFQSSFLFFSNKNSRNSKVLMIYVLQLILALCLHQYLNFSR